MSGEGSIREIRELADRFIRSQVAAYGLNGSNTQKNPPAGFPSGVRGSDQFFSVSNSFVFGYNGEAFNFRESSTCMYWTETLPPRRPVLSLHEELKKAAHEIFLHESSIGIVYTASGPSRLALRELAGARSGKIVVVLPVWDDGRFNLKPHLENDLSLWDLPHVEVRPVHFGESEFQSFFEEANRVSRCVDATIAFSLFVSKLGAGQDHPTLPFIHEAAWPKLTNQNFDRVQGQAIGPEHWCLEDCESDTDAARYLMAVRRKGFVSFNRATPELFAAFLSEVLGSIDQTDEKFSLGEIPDSFFETATGIGQETEASRELSLFLRSLEPEMNRRSPKAREIWLTSIDRKNEAVYGFI